MSKYQSDAELIENYAKRQKTWRMIGLVAVLAFFVIAAVILIPKFTGKADGTGSGTGSGPKVSSADLAANRDRMKPSEIKAAEKNLVKSTSVSGEESSGDGSGKPVLSVNDAVAAKLNAPPKTGDEPNSLASPDAPVDGLRERIIQLDAADTKQRHATADEVVAKFLEASTPEEKAAYVVDSARVLPLMRDFYSREGVSGDAIGNLVGRTFYKIKGKDFVIEQRRVGDGSRNVVFVGLMDSGDGNYKIDWESMVAYSEMGWETFLKLRPSDPVLFRCYAVPEAYYNFQYSDPDKWMCVKLINHRTLDAMYGYVEIGSETQGQLVAALRKRIPASVLVRISFPEGSKGRNLVKIDELVQDTWLVVPTS